MSGVIPKWADDLAGHVLTMFARGDTEHIDRALLHGAFAAALVQERERCARIADEQAAREEYGHAKHAAVTIAQNIRGEDA